MKRPKLWSRLSPRTKDIIWHAVKAALCLVQLYALTAPAYGTISSICHYLMDDPGAPIYFALLFVVQVGVSIALWVYYDRNDDRSFDRFCEPDETPRLLSEPAYLVGLGITVAGCTAVFFISLFPFLLAAFPTMPPVPAALAALAIGALVAAAGSLLAVASQAPAVHSLRKGDQLGCPSAASCFLLQRTSHCLGAIKNI